MYDKDSSWQPINTQPSETSPDNVSTTTNPPSSQPPWQPADPTIFLIMQSAFAHSTPTLSHESIEPIAHCPSLEAAHHALDNLALQRPHGDLLKDSKWGWFQTAGEQVTHTFWIKEVGHARGLEWMEFGDEEGDGWGVDEDIAFTDGVSHTASSDAGLSNLATTIKSRMSDGDENSDVCANKKDV